MGVEDFARPIDAVDHAIRLGRLTAEQRRAFEQLSDDLTPEALRRFTAAWRAKPPAPAGGPLLLDVPYFSQRDSATGQGDRMCFSSTCAMAAEFLKPGCLAGAGQPDDRYLALVNRFGDSTDAAAQVKALGQIGIAAEFRQDGSIDSLAQQLAAGIPVPVGWLHKGHVSAPSGGGHWTLAIGWDPAAQTVIMHDPYGEALLIAGGYARTANGSGRGVQYSAENWGRRWQAGPGGPYRYVPGTGWWLKLAR